MVHTCFCVVLRNCRIFVNIQASVDITKDGLPSEKTRNDGYKTFSYDTHVLKLMALIDEVNISHFLQKH